MADKRDRLFVEILFNAAETDPDQLSSLVVQRLGSFEVSRVSINKPPEVIEPEYIRARFAELLVVSGAFCSAFSKKFGDEIAPDPRLLWIAVRSAYDDISRYKMYHLSRPYADLSDCVKRSAYITKWFSRVKPLQLIQLADKDIEVGSLQATPAKASMANVMFAINCSMKYFECELGFRPNMDVKVYAEMIYDLTYREVNTDSLLMFFQLLSDRLSGSSLIEKA